MNNITNIGQLFQNLSSSLAVLQNQFDILRKEVLTLRVAVQPVVDTQASKADGNGVSKVQKQLTSVMDELQDMRKEMQKFVQTHESTLKSISQNLLTVEGNLSSRIAVLEIKENERKKYLTVDDVRSMIDASVNMMLGDLNSFNTTNNPIFVEPPVVPFSEDLAPVVTEDAVTSEPISVVQTHETSQEAPEVPIVVTAPEVPIVVTDEVAPAPAPAQAPRAKKPRGKKKITT